MTDRDSQADKQQEEGLKEGKKEGPELLSSLKTRERERGPSQHGANVE